TTATRPGPSRLAARIAAPKSLAPMRLSMRATSSAGGMTPENSLVTAVSSSADISADPQTALTSRSTRARSPTARSPRAKTNRPIGAGGLPADKPPDGRGVAPLLPQPRLRAPAHGVRARPVRIGLEEGGVAIEASRTVGIAQYRPFDELSGTRIVQLGRQR